MLVYYGDILLNSDNIIRQVIEDLQLDKNKHKSLSVILTTNGGSLSPVERIVNVFLFLSNRLTIFMNIPIFKFVLNKPFLQN